MKKFLVLFSLLFLATASVWAQVFPVQATTQLSPPYSLYLADYVASGSERLALNVYLADIARPQLDVRFRLRIVGQGITIETKQEYRPAPVSIQGGVPVRLISTDLADYFNANNLNFQGITRREYEQRGKLPEGVYQFCFEVLEYNRGVKISNTACATAWLILNDPPIINLPGRDEKLKAQSPQNVVLQWTPRHTGSPNSAFTTEYEVTMVEVWPSTRNPNDAILTSPPVLQTTTANTTFIYGPAETPLEPGRRYAFRVKAKSIAGVDELDLFKNNGYSEVYSFIYGDACDLPTGIAVSAVSPTKFTVAWQGTFNQTAFRVRYREVGTAAWYDSNITIPELQVTSLKPGTTYEYQIAATCGFFDGQYTTSGKVTTMELPEAAYACNSPVQTFDLDPAQLTGSLKVGDVIDAGDFNVKLTKVSGSNGVFSGEGVVEVPYFNKAKIRTSFENISVNKELRMVNGFMNVTGGGVDIVPQKLLDGLDKLDEVMDVIDSALTTVEENLPKDFDPDGFVADTLITVKDGIHSVYKNDDGSVVVVDKSGNTQTLPAGANYAVKDNAGNGYLIDSKGNIHKTTADVAAKAGSREYKLELTFGPAPLAKNGFDPYKHKALEKDYEHLKDNYSVAWKAVAVGGNDPVTAVLKSTAIDKSKIRFELGGKAVSAPPFTGQETTVSVTSGTDGDTESLLAILPAADSTGKDQVLGKLNVATYAEITQSVVIVPVGDIAVPVGLTAEKIAADLNKIYAQAVVNWRVSIADRIQHTLPSPFDDGESGILSNYTGDMKDVIKAFGKLQDETFYLFLVKNPRSGSALGYMPRSKQAGFIFMDRHADADAITRTMAHELGHGAFNLHHIFKEPNFQITQGETDNLMDYPAGEKLYKYQWDKMRFNDIVIDVFEEDEEGESRFATGGIRDEWRNPDKTVNFMAPNGKIVRLPAVTTQAYFTFGIGEYRSKELEMLPAGMLDEFETTAETSGGKKIVTHYYATWSGKKFLGYYADPATLKEPATFYLPKGESVNEGAGTAIMHAYNAKGSQVIRYSGLPNPYMTSNPAGDDYVDVTNVGLSQIKATASRKLEEFTFDNKQIAFGVNAVSPRPEYAGMYDFLASEDDKLKCYLVTTKIYEYRIVYPDVFNKMTVNFGDWTELNVKIKTISNELLNDQSLMKTILDLPKDQITAGYFEYYLAKNGLYLNNTSDQKQIVLIHFLNEFRKMIDHQQEINKKAIQLIATSNYCAAKAVVASLKPIEIRNAIEAMSTEDLKLICADARAHLVGTILEAGVVENSLERAIYKLMWTCPEEPKAKAMFLQALAGETDSDNEYILGKMVRAIDDRTLFMGANFNTMIMNYIIRAYGDYMKYAVSNPGDIKDTESQKEIVEMSKLSPEAIKYLDKTKLADFQKKIIAYNYVGFTKRLFKEVMITLCEGCQYAFDPNTKSVVEYKEATGTLTYTNKAVQGFATVSESTPLPLRALQPIMLDDKAKLIDVYASSKEDGGMFIPAITLYFIEKKADARTTVEGIGTAVDLASLAIPGANATLALKLLNYADKLSSVASLVGNATNDDYPKLAQFLQISSAVLGGINLVGSGMVPKIEDLTALKDVEKAVDAINQAEGFMEAEKHLEEVHKLCDRITAMDPNDKVLIEMLSHGKGERKLLMNALELEKSAASAAENSVAVKKLEGAIEKLRGYQNAANGIAALSRTEKLKTVFSRMVTKFGDKFRKTADNKFLAKGDLQVAHLNGNGELVFDHLDELGGLSASAKLEENVADAAFYTKGKATETVDDILVFDDNGVIKCVSGNNCFVAGTPVHTKEGIKPIQQVATGDVVRSYDELSSKNVWQRVTNVFSKKAKKLQRIVSGRDTLWATPEHKFYEKTRGWVTAAALSTTMLLHTAEGYADIKSNVSVDTIATVYNFTVQNTHTYYVGRQTILTHNDCHAIGQFLTGLGERQSAFLGTFGKHRSIIEKFATGQFDVAHWDMFISLGFKGGDDVAAFFGKIDGWDKNLLSKLAADLKSEASLKAVLSNLDASKKLAALDAWAAIAKGSKMSTLSKADMAAIINRMVSFGDEAGKFNPARVQALTDKFVGLFGSLGEAVPRASLVALLKENADAKVFELIAGWNSDLQKTFLTGLLARQKTLGDNITFLADHLKDLDVDLLNTFERLGGLAPIRRYDYNLLLSCKNKFGDELIDIVGQETRAKKAADLLSTYPGVAALIKKTDYRDNLRKSIEALYKGKAKNAATLDAFINMYAKDTDLFKKLTDLKKLPSDQLGEAIEALFKNDFNAHHILPVNMLYNNDVCLQIMEWAINARKTDFAFHDIDNLIFLRNINHTAGTYGHNVYDKLFAAHLNTWKNLVDADKHAEAYRRMKDMVNQYKNHIANTLIGTPQKLDNLTGLPGL